MIKERSAFIDILKAIGIISIVIGHCGWSITSYNINIDGLGTTVCELLHKYGLDADGTYQKMKKFI